MKIIAADFALASCLLGACHVATIFSLSLVSKLTVCDCWADADTDSAESNTKLVMKRLNRIATVALIELA
jgi:hypothetical protein